MSWDVPGLMALAPARVGIKVVASIDLAADTMLGVLNGTLCRYPLRDGVPDYGHDDAHHMLDLYTDQGWHYALLMPHYSAVNRINHSCRPNCHRVGVHGLALTTLRAIGRGEELTYDYRPITMHPLGVRCWCEVAEGERCVL